MEEVSVKTAKRKLDLRDFGTVLAFLVLEVLAFIGFNLGHSFLLFAILSLVLAILLVAVTFRQIKKDGLTTYLFFLFPLVIFGILTALNGFNYYSIGAICMANSIFVPIGLLGIGLSGFLTSYLKQFKIKYALLVTYCALGLFVLINLFITMIYYVPFYTIIYKNYYIFYNGKPSSVPIGEMAYMLYGFRFKEVSLTYWTLYPSILLTAVIPLFFIKFKENKKEFLIYAGLAFLAFISLLFTISKMTLITDAILVLGISLIIVGAKIKNSRSVLNVMMITLGIIFLVIILILFINAQTSWGFTSGIRNIISSNSMLNRLFNTNRYVSPIDTIFQDLFTTFKLFGCPVGGSFLDYPNGVPQILSNMWLFDNLMSSGLFGAVFFLAGLVIGIRRLFKYLNKGTDEDYIKYLITGLVLGFLVISMLLFDNYPLINSDNMAPFYTSAPLLICVFFLGYVFNHTLQLEPSKLDKELEEKAKKELEVEEVNEDEEISI
ncbi:MAG: hypothetical protein J5666_00160 [Bacilli bacterium]|nr:hypothetical protein [Bacilli bacterium]